MTTIGVEWDTTALICDSKNSFREKFPIIKSPYYSITTESWQQYKTEDDCIWSLEVNLGPFKATYGALDTYYNNFVQGWEYIITNKSINESPIVTYSIISDENQTYYSDCCKTKRGYSDVDKKKAYVDSLQNITGNPQITLGFPVKDKFIFKRISFMSNRKRTLEEQSNKKIEELIKFLNSITSWYDIFQAYNKNLDIHEKKSLKGSNSITKLLVESWNFSKNQENISELAQIILFLIIYNIIVRIYYKSIITSGYLKAFFLLKPRTNIGTIINLLSKNEKTQIKKLCKDFDFFNYFISKDFPNINLENEIFVNIIEYLTSIFPENENEKPIGYVLVGPIPENIIIDVPNISHKKGFNKNIFNFSSSTLGEFDKLGIEYEEITYSYDTDTTFGAKIPELILKEGHLQYKNGSDEVLNWDIGEWAYDPNNPQIIVECRAPLTLLQLYHIKRLQNLNEKLKHYPIESQESKELREELTKAMDMWTKTKQSGLLNIQTLEEVIKIFIDFVS